MFPAVWESACICSHITCTNSGIFDLTAEWLSYLVSCTVVCHLWSGRCCVSLVLVQECLVHFVSVTCTSLVLHMSDVPPRSKVLHSARKPSLEEMFPTTSHRPVLSVMLGHLAFDVSFCQTVQMYVKQFVCGICHCEVIGALEPLPTVYSGGSVGQP